MSENRRRDELIRVYYYKLIKFLPEREAGRNKFIYKTNNVVVRLDLMARVEGYGPPATGLEAGHSKRCLGL